MSENRDVFQAIADPTRRQIISMLARESLNVNAIAKQFEMSRQAVSLHVQFLRECGLISVMQQGRERLCVVRLEKLDTVRDWVEKSKEAWLQKFQSLENYLVGLEEDKVKKNKNVNDGKRKK